MRCLKRNQVKFYYATYLSRRALSRMDEYGNEILTGEYQSLYSDPIVCDANISPASGAMITELFGSDERYDKVLVMDNPKTPINEYSILWIDTTPEVIVDDAEGQPLEITLGNIIVGDNGHFKPHDYVVKRVARSLNSVAIAVSKVNVG